MNPSFEHLARTRQSYTLLVTAKGITYLTMEVAFLALFTRTHDCIPEQLSSTETRIEIQQTNSTCRPMW